MVCDADTGALRPRRARAPHPDGTSRPATPGGRPSQRPPRGRRAGRRRGDLRRRPAARHGLPRRRRRGGAPRAAVERHPLGGRRRRPARRLGGAQAWADAVGMVPVAAFTVTKLRWLAQHEPDDAARTAAVCLPHDWLTWRLARTGGLDALATDRSDASGTGYWSPATGDYRRDLLKLAFGRDLRLPAVLGPADGRRGRLRRGAARAGRRRQRGRRARRRRRGPATWSSPSARPAPSSGADVARRRRHRHGRRLRRRHRPLPAAGCTLNAARVLDAAARCSASTTPSCPAWRCRRRRERTAWSCCRTWRASAPPTCPTRTGSLHGLTLGNVDAGAPGPGGGRGDALRPRRRPRRAGGQGVAVDRVLLIGGGAASRGGPPHRARLFGVPVSVPRPASTSPTAPPARRPGRSPAAPSRPAWERGHRRCLRGRPPRPRRPRPLRRRGGPRRRTTRLNLARRPF